MRSRLPGELCHLLRADPAFRADDQDDLPASRELDTRYRLAGSWVQHDGKGCGPDPPCGGGEVGPVRHLREPGSPGLLGSLLSSRVPAGPRLGGPVTAPHCHAPVGGPGHDDVRPHLGQQLNSELASIALRYGLKHCDLRFRPLLRSPSEHGQLQFTGPHRCYDALGYSADSVCDVGPLARREAPDRAGMTAFLTGQHDALATDVGRRGDEDRRLQDRPALDSAAVERIAEPRKEAVLARRELAGRRFLAAELGEVAQQFFLFGLELGRGLDGDVNDQVTPA